MRQKFAQTVMAWFGVCSKGITPLVILHRGTVDHVEYIEKVLPISLKYGNDAFVEYWTFQQDRARPHIHHLTQKWHFPSFIDKNHWPAK